MPVCHACFFMFHYNLAPHIVAQSTWFGANVTSPLREAKATQIATYCIVCPFIYIFPSGVRLLVGLGVLQVFDMGVGQVIKWIGSGLQIKWCGLIPNGGHM